VVEFADWKHLVETVSAVQVPRKSRVAEAEACGTSASIEVTNDDDDEVAIALRRIRAMQGQVQASNQVNELQDVLPLKKPTGLFNFAISKSSPSPQIVHTPPRKEDEYDSIEIMKQIDEVLATDKQVVKASTIPDKPIPSKSKKPVKNMLDMF
jgi:hypothetical protein